MPITLELIQEHIKDWEKLGSEFARIEMEQNSRFVHNPQTQEVWWPAPWVDDMKADIALAKFAEKLKPIDPSALAPMTDRLCKLADVFDLPHYEGTAEPNPFEKQAPLQKTGGIGASRTPTSGRSAKSTLGERRRCPRCGSWMKRGHDGRRSLLLACPSCGHQEVAS